MAGLEPASAESTSTAVYVADQQAVRASMWATVPHLLAQHRYVVLGTADEGDRPWVTPVFYAADGEDEQRSFKQGVTMHRYAICDVSEASPC
jgi:hypothetical protein